MLLPVLPPARELLGDRGYDSNRFRQALARCGIAPCIPSTRSRKVHPGRFDHRDIVKSKRAYH